MINAEQYKKMIDEAKKTMLNLSVIQEETMRILADKEPEKFAQISEDFRVVRETKDLNTLNEILNKYANSSNNE